MNVSRFLTALLLSVVAFNANAVTVEDTKGAFTLNDTPKRIVALEYSYVDALSQVGVSPVGVADDKDVSRILQSVRDKIDTWESVGTRSQPSLEAIAVLKPDLIIADDNRHSAVYAELQKIAPTVVFNSRHESYQDGLITSQKIADLVGKSEEMTQKLSQHQAKIAEFAAQVPKGKKLAIIISRENEARIFNAQSYPGGLAALLGFELPQAINKNEPNIPLGLEQLVTEQPDILLISHYRDESLAKKWQSEALWQLIPAVKNNKVFEIDGNLWSRARGIDAAEIMAKHLVEFSTP